MIVDNGRLSFSCHFFYKPFYHWQAVGHGGAGVAQGLQGATPRASTVDDVRHPQPVGKLHRALPEQLARRLAYHLGIDLTHATRYHEGGGSFAYHLIGHGSTAQHGWLLIPQAIQVGHAAPVECVHAVAVRHHQRVTTRAKLLHQLIHLHIMLLV